MKFVSGLILLCLLMIRTSTIHAWIVPECGFLPSPIPPDQFVTITSLFATADDFGAAISSGCETTNNILSTNCEAVPLNTSDLNAEINNIQNKIDNSNILLFVGFNSDDRTKLVNIVHDLNEKMPILIVEDSQDKSRNIGKDQDSGLAILKVRDFREIPNDSDERAKMSRIINGMVLSNTANEIMRSHYSDYSTFAEAWLSGK